MTADKQGSGPGAVPVDASGAGSHLEVELKFDVDEAVALPSLLDVESVAALEQPVEQHLEATYFDTPDLRLAQAGITLRRRTGGADDGWHLKLPKAKNERLEVHRPLGRAIRTVPKPLAGLVRAYVRDQPLGPVATLSTRRIVHRLLDHEGGVLAEVADDHVVGTAAAPAVSARVDGWGEGRSGRDGHQEAADPAGAAARHRPGSAPPEVTSRWRELEVEQVGGARDLLAAVGEQLLAAGATPASSASKLARLLGDRVRPAPDLLSSLDASAPAGDVLRGYLAEQTTALLTWDPRARTDEPDAVHKMRVAARRLRSALATYRKLLDDTVTGPVRDELKWLGQVLGEPRDAEVMHARLRDRVATLPAEVVLGPVRRRIDTTLRSQHREAHARLVSELDGPRYFELLDALDALVSEPPLTKAARGPADSVLPGRVAKTRKRVLRLADQVEAADAADSTALRDHLLHEVRKAAKRSRYAGESVEAVLGAKATKFAARMEHLQEVLGEHQDSIVTRALLRELGAQAHAAGENAFTFGVLHGIEHGHGERAEHEYTAALAAACDKRPKWLR